MVSSETFDRHFNDTKSGRESAVDSYDWRPKYTGDIVTVSSGYRHSFSDPIMVGNATKKLKTSSQNTLQSKFSKILRDYSKFLVLLLWVLAIHDSFLGFWIRGFIFRSLVCINFVRYTRIRVSLLRGIFLVVSRIFHFHE